MIQPSRILMTADTVGGVWTYAMELARGLSARGVEVVLATMGGAITEAQREQAEGIANLQLHTSAFLLEWMEEPWEDVDAAGRWLLELSRAHGVDLVHLNGYAHAALEWDVPVLVVAHSCVATWWEAVKTGEMPVRYEEYARRVREGVEAADIVAAPTAAFREMFARCWGMDAEDIQVIYNGRTPGLFPPGRKEPMVFCAGRVWDEGKNLRMLADIDLGDFGLFIAGDGAGMASPRFLGKLDQPQVASYMARAGIFASPAKYEPFGLSVLEAALSGCALVLTDIPTMRELWEDAAIFLPADDAEAWRCVLLGLLERGERRERLGEEARRRALNYTTERMADDYLNTYARMMEGKTQNLEEAMEVAGSL